MLSNPPSRKEVQAMRSRALTFEREGEYWTDEEKHRLQVMFEAGIGITEIACTLRRSEVAVLQQIEKMDLYNRKSNPRRRCAVRKQSCCLCSICTCDPQFCPNHAGGTITMEGK